jgi:hypothetical protein
MTKRSISTTIKCIECDNMYYQKVIMSIYENQRRKTKRFPTQ